MDKRKLSHRRVGSRSNPGRILSYGPGENPVDKSITSTIIIFLSLAMIMPLTQPTVRAIGPPYSWNGPADVRSQLGQDNLPTAVQAANGTLWLAWQTFRFSNTRPDIIYQTLTNG